VNWRGALRRLIARNCMAPSLTTTTHKRQHTNDNTQTTRVEIQDMQSAVRGGGMALRLLWIINIALGIYISYIATNPGGWVLAHMVTGILIVALLWFLGVAQGLLKTGSLGLTVATFLVGLALPIVGMSQLSVPDGGGLYAVQGLHVVLAVAAIALGEICVARYRKGIAAAAAK
jgi:hypothetical protein